MTTLNRLVIEWTGPQIVGRAVTVLHYSGAEGDAPPVAAVLSAFDGLKSLLPSGVLITVPGSGDKITDTDGSLAGVWAASGGGVVTATGPAAAAAGVGACVGWTTGGIVEGTKGPRKLRGRTFIVPVTNLAYDGSGHFAQGSITQLVTFANALMAAGPLAVWHRPTTVGGTDGNSYGVVAAKVRNKVAFLSSRRD